MTCAIWRHLKMYQNELSSFRRAEVERDNRITKTPRHLKMLGRFFILGCPSRFEKRITNRA